MPPRTPQPNSSQKPVRRLRLPKVTPPKMKGLFEEYFYTILAVIFVFVAILGRAGGLSGYNALVVGAWVAVFLWFARQFKGYFAEKSKVASGKVVAAPAVPAEQPKGPLGLPPGMKPMIGPQWPIKSGSWPARPGLTAAPSVQTPTVPTQPASTSTVGARGAVHAKKPGFVYERPTLPNRKPKLPNNWRPPEGKKPKR